jgi:hypothetical protein
VGITDGDGPEDGFSDAEADRAAFAGEEDMEPISLAGNKKSRASARHWHDDPCGPSSQPR